MLLEHLFARNEKLGSWWANAAGKALSGLAEGFVLSVKDATHVHVPAGADEDAAVVAVMGHWRWVEAEIVQAHPGGAAGTYDVFVTAADNVVDNSPLPLTDHTDRSFAIAIVAHGSTPGGVALYRKVGEVDWSGSAITALRQLVPASPSHQFTHEPGGADALTGLTDASMAAANKDGVAGTPSLRTLGNGAQQATAGNDARLSNARTPTAHASSHQPGGGDAMAVDAAAGVGSLRTLGPGATQAAPGNDARLSDARTPVGHHATHEPGGTDAMAADAAAGIASLRTLGPGATQAAPGNDARLSNSRSPTAHAGSHQPGGTDALAVDAAAGTGSLRTLGPGAAQAAPGNDARLSDARTPTAHVASHQPGGTDALAVDAAAGTGSLRTLGPGATQAAPGNDARLSNARTPTAHAASHNAGGTDALAIDTVAGTGSLRTLGPGAQQAAPGNDARLADARTPTAHAGSHARGGTDAVGGLPPVGAMVPYSGTGDPAGGDWVVADGRLIDKTTFAAFFAVTGHTYNSGVDPGSNQVRIPDKRGRTSVGAINMGTSTGANTNGRVQSARGVQDGEATHQLVTGELASHTHGVTDPSHQHNLSADDHPYVPRNKVAFGTVNVTGGGGNVVMTINAASGGDLESFQLSDFHTTGISTNSRGSDTAHNNIPPYESDSWLVRIA